jgi:proteasome alpha subunit
MTEEPYRWLEAITNRREYIEDQLAPGRPVVALSGEPGILLLTVKTSTPKLFEIYDHLALGSLGHPADIEKVRQAANSMPPTSRASPARRATCPRAGSPAITSRPR